MEFDLLDLNQIIMSLSNEQMISDAQHANTRRASTTDQSVQVDLDKQQQPPLGTTASTGDRRYCLIIFNNPIWSARLRKRPQQTDQHPLNVEERDVVKSEPNENVSTDDLFIAQLRQLIRDYMQRTTRPFPLKYFLDFTEH